MFLAVSGFVVPYSLIVALAGTSPSDEKRREAASAALSLRTYFVFLWRRLLRLWPALAASIAVLFVIGQQVHAGSSMHKFYFEEYSNCRGKGLGPLLLSLGFASNYVEGGELCEPGLWSL